MKTETNPTIYLKDYKELDFTIDSISLEFDLFKDFTYITSTLNIKTKTKLKELFLNGENLELIDINFSKDDYKLEESGLTLLNPKGSFELVTKVKVYPHENLELEGLYLSSGIFCTQNEAQGFRKITFFPDRPDMMTVFKTKITASKDFPCLLSNGNLIEKGEVDTNRHYVIWEDPFKKPCYLFALVAGDLGILKDQYKTMSGRTIDLEIYCDKGNEYRLTHAMESLKKSMKWDEDVYGLEYDLDLYMIVSVDSFNMGAMENKGLNIFNSVYTLADPKSATDSDYQDIEAVIGHEYFHNWTGNRVTCRDWFQLTLKEGLTVFRDQEFSADMQSRAVKRIEDVKVLRSHQFSEDAGPMAHPIRPESYMEINNFYTATVYNKGAEVIRMAYNLIGRSAWRKSLDKYFELFDGKAVTTDDFIHALELGSGKDLTHFKKSWYSQAGTPVINISSKSDNNSFKLSLTQTCPNTPGQKDKKPFYLPFPIALYNKEGEKIHEEVLIIKEQSHEYSWSYSDVYTVSLNLNFASPVKVNYEYTDEELSLLMAHDQDEFNRFEASQLFSIREIKKIIQNSNYKVSDNYLNSYGALLSNSNLDPALKAYSLTSPSYEDFFGDQEVLLIDETIDAIKNFKKQLGISFADKFKKLYLSLDQTTYSLDSLSIGKRTLKNTCLKFLCYSNQDEFFELASHQYFNKDNMTDQLSAFEALGIYQNKYQEKVSNDFYEKWHKDPLVFCKWLETESVRNTDDFLSHIEALKQKPVFNIHIPNQVRSLVRGFVYNLKAYHHISGKGYDYFADFISMYDKINPQVTARLCGFGFGKLSRLDETRYKLMKKALDKLMEEKLSKNTYEILSKTMQDAKR